MGKIIETSITRFDGGITSDPREENTRYARLVKHFDIATYPHKLVPYRSSEDGDSGASTSQKVNFLFANSKLYGLGVVSGSSKASVHTKNDYTNAAWSDPSGNTSSAGARDEEFFVHYKNYIYGLRAGTSMWRHGDITGTPSWDDSWDSITYSNAAQGLVHSKDDILYIPVDNKIYKYDNSTKPSSAGVLTLPSDRTITSICEYGNYLAIAAKPSSGIGKSRVFFWDLTSTSWNESVDWGEGNIQILEEVEGVLIGISFDSTNSFVGRITFRYYAGGKPVLFQELVSEAVFVTGDLPLSKQKVNNTLYFLLTITLNGTKHQGVWKIARSRPDAPFAVSLAYLPNNDTALTSGTLEGFFILGGYVFIAYTSNSAYALSKTDDQANYDVTAQLDSLINPGIPAQYQGSLKQLEAVSLHFEPLPASGQAVLQYRVDGGAWTTILTNTTDSAVADVMTLDASGAQFTSGREYEYRIKSSGGAVITGLKARYQLLENVL